LSHIWIISICAILLFGLFGLYVYAWSIPTLQLFAPAILRGPADGNRIALTFDDGPCAGYTEQILDILRRHQVKATFFVCGQNVKRSPEILRRIQAEGHSIGNHSYSHRFPFFRSRAFFAREIDLTQEAIEKITGKRPKFFRPPFGARWLGLQPVLKARGLSLVNWSDTGYDWKLDTEGIVRETLKTLGPGSIILLHDGRTTRPPEKVDRSPTVKALAAILEGAMKAGFTFVSLEELLATETDSRGQPAVHPSGLSF
jgi:peptidoglycan/xylan/chitin deacetylase (PgdA/CDA1 family)